MCFDPLHVLNLRLHFPGVLWVYHNVPHYWMKEKPSFLLLGIDCCTSSEATLLPSQELESTEVYREELILYLSLLWED